MKETGERIAAAALAMVGTPFRLHGRDKEHGVDCLGLVVCAIEAATNRKVIPPRGYGLRNSSIGHMIAFADTAGLVEVPGVPRSGDIILACPGPAQHHLLIAESRGWFIHAHIGLRRVVRVPGPIVWPSAKHWRLTATS